MHIDEWKSLKLSDFPQFKCLCELCDCGCFNKSNKKHSSDCKKRIERVKNGLEAYNSKFEAFQETTVYSTSFNNKPSNKNISSNSTDNQTTLEQLDQISKLKYPIKNPTVKLASLEITDKNEKISTRTTNRDHFQGWISNPAKSVKEYPDNAGQLIYPTANRRMITTNGEFFLKNYGIHKAETNAINLFEKTFKLNQGKMDFKTIYRQDYPRFHKDIVANDQNERVTRYIVERRNQKLIKDKIPMQTKTQNMIDFSYDKREFEKAFGISRSRFYPDFFKTSLDENRLRRSTNLQNGRLSDISEENEFENELRSKSQVNFGSFHKKPSYKLRKNKIKLMEHFEMIPDLHVIKKLTGDMNKKRILPPIPSKQFLSASMDDLNMNKNKTDFEFDDGLCTSYRNDFKNPGGFEICRLKAYTKLISNSTNNKIQNNSKETTSDTN